MSKDVISIIGKEKYIELLKKYNLCTKKWTYGRAKGFYQEVTKIINQMTIELRKK